MTRPKCSLTRPATAVALLLATACAGGGPGEVERQAARLHDAALDDGVAWELLESLTVEVGPRLAGSRGDRRAVAWARAAMRRLGLVEVRSEAVAVPRWVRGKARGKILAPFPQPLVLTALGGSVGTPEGGIEAEVVAAGSLEELAELPDAAVAGRIVFLDRATERARDGSGYGDTVPIRTRGAAAAAAKGAVAVLIRSVGTDSHRLPHTGTVRYAEEVQRIPAAALANPDADLLAAQLGRRGHRAQRATKTEAVRVRLELTSHYLPDAPSANVIGEVRGRELPDEVVLLGAHLDSWDLGTGAIDDGAGCAIVLAAARRLAELPRPPRRSVRVVLFANEEFGLSGARAYALRHADELPRHFMAVESDLGAAPVWRFRTRVAPAALPAVEGIAGVLAPYGVEWLGNQASGGADLSPLRPERVPLADLTQDASRYFDLHHTADDTLDKVDPAELARNVAVYTAFAYWAAETPAELRPAPEPPPERP